ncbi:MAG: tetratricopeptide repeat protein [Planctomycetota bacterium]
MDTQMLGQGRGESGAFERGCVFYEQGQAGRAVEQFQQAVAESPDDARPHAYLAASLMSDGGTERAEGREQIGRHVREAVRLAPGWDLPHRLQSTFRLMEGGLPAAESSAKEAMRLNPDEPANYGVAARVELSRKRWPDALEWIDRGLAIDAEDADLLSLRGMALAYLGRRKEANAASREALRQAPEDADAHSARGFALLHANRPKDALHHFRESLRLDPTDEYAKAGLVEALKARNPIYRACLAYFLWMSRLSGGVVIGLIVGAYVLIQILNGVSARNPSLAPYIDPVIWTYIGFVAMTWVAMPLFNLLLFINPSGRHALDPYQRRGAAVLGFFLLIAGVALVVGIVTGVGSWLGSAAVAGVIAVTASSVLQTEETSRRNILTGLALLNAGIGIYLVLLLFRVPYPEAAVDSATTWFAFSLLAFMLSPLFLGAVESKAQG